MSEQKQEQKSEQKQNSVNWTTWVALSTAAMAVLTALTTLYMGKYSSRTVLQQMQESDTWAFYQAKSIKSHTYELQKQLMELQYLAQKNNHNLSNGLDEKFKQVIDSYDQNLKRYDSEKKEIKAKAEDLGKEKQVSQMKGAKFAYGLIFLQVAIMLSSISAITKKKPLWYMGIGMAMVGFFFFLDGFYLFI